MLSRVGLTPRQYGGSRASANLDWDERLFYMSAWNKIQKDLEDNNK